MPASRRPLAPGLAVLLLACGTAPVAPIDAAATGDASVPDASPPDAVPGSPAVAELTATALDFDLADCGGAAPPAQTVRLRNGGGTTLRWSATVRFTPQFRVAGTSGGQLGPGDTVDIAVEPQPIAATATAGQRLADVLLITHDDVTRGPFEVPLEVRARGATFTVTPSMADFGLIPVGAPAPAIPLTITNTGNAPALVALTSPASGGLATSFAGGPGAAAVAPGGSLPGATAAFTPASSAAVTATAALSVTGAVCGASASGLTLRGQGTIAVAVVSPALVDFGLTSCGETAMPHAFFVANTGNQPLTWSASLDAGEASRYTLVPPSGLVGPGSNQVVAVHAAAMPTYAAVTPNLFGETVTVTTSAPGDVPRTIALAQTARGVIVEFAGDATMTTPYSLLEAGAAPTDDVTIRNVGNVATTATISSDSGAFTLLGGPDVELAAGQSVTGTLAFAPVVAGPNATTLRAAATGTLCAPLPTASATGEVTVTAPGQGPIVEALFANDHVKRSNQATMCARTRGGQVVCLGSTSSGLLGVPTGQASATVPVVVHTATGTLTDVVDLAAGRDWFCAERADASQWCWGNLPSTIVANHSSARGGTGVLGRATLRLDGLGSLTGSGPIGCGVTPAGAMACFANASNGVSDAAGWTLTDVTEVAAHARGAYALRPDGTVWSFGTNQRGERGDTVLDNAPGAAIPGLADIVAVVAGSGGRGRNGTKHGCALRDDETVWCWGRGRMGRLGDGTEDDRTTPVQVVLADGVTPLGGVTAIAAGREFSCARTAADVYCWGRGTEGQLGRGTTSTSFVAAPTVPALPGVVALRAGDRQACATLADGAVRCWGQTGFGVLVSPTAIDAFEPAPAP